MEQNANVNDFSVMLGQVLNELKDGQKQITKTNQNVSATLDVYGNQIITHSNQIKDLYKRFDQQSITVNDIQDEIVKIKENDRIEPFQVREFKKDASKRIFNFLENGTEDYMKYSKTYYSDLYRYLRTGYKLMKPIELTKKKDYDDIMIAIQTWIPNELKLRDKADLCASNRKKAREQGYIN